MNFFLSVCVYGDYISEFIYIEPSLHIKDEAYLIRVDDIFDEFLDLICEYFIEYFCICVHRKIWSEIVFLCWVFVWFRYWGDYELVEWVCNVASVFILWNSVRSIVISSFLKANLVLPKAIWLWAFYITWNFWWLILIL